MRVLPTIHSAKHTADASSPIPRADERPKRTSARADFSAKIYAHGEDEDNGLPTSDKVAGLSRSRFPSSSGTTDLGSTGQNMIRPAFNQLRKARRTKEQETCPV